MLNDTFEQLTAKFISKAATSVPGRLSSVIFASPLSARNPDVCMLWHPGYRNRHGARLFIELSLSVFSGCLKGLIRLVSNFRPFGYALYGKIDDTILVVASVCGRETTDGRYKTAYVFTEDNDGLFVFGREKSCGKNATRVKDLSIGNKLILMHILIKSGISAFIRIRSKAFEKGLLLLQWLSWSVSLDWLRDCYLEESLSKIVEKYGIKKIGCTHEMHSYARIVWRVAAKYNAVSYTIQHAALSSGKRWYFCYPEEKKKGLKLPDVMYI